MIMLNRNGRIKMLVGIVSLQEKVTTTKTLPFLLGNAQYTLNPVLFIWKNTTRKMTKDAYFQFHNDKVRFLKLSK